MTEHTAAAEKVLTRADLIGRFGHPRDERVVFTNGCFDVLHRGHVTYLEQARRLGDALVVGLNTDASVTRLKGPGRPLVSEQDRALVLAGLASVSAVILFEEDTPSELVTALQPDVLVKGGDYRLEEIVGAEIVEGSGGRVVVLPYVDGSSTTNLIQRMREITP